MPCVLPNTASLAHWPRPKALPSLLHLDASTVDYEERVAVERWSLRNLFRRRVTKSLPEPRREEYADLPVANDADTAAGAAAASSRPDGASLADITRPTVQSPTSAEVASQGAPLALSRMVLADGVDDDNDNHDGDDGNDGDDGDGDGLSSTGPTVASTAQATVTELVTARADSGPKEDREATQAIDSRVAAASPKTQRHKVGG